MNIRDDNYWEQKIGCFLHDPIDKALRIPGHEERAKEIADAFGVSIPLKSEVCRYDIIAAGLDRANMPGYSKNSSENGAIDFHKNPQITHPVSGGSIKFTGEFDSAQQTTRQISDLIRKDTNKTEQRWNKQTYFNYLFFLLRKRVISENCGNLGFLWERIPADSRMPDHSIWNHAGMVSALYTSFTQSAVRGASMVIFSISPIQPFITKTRKLKDHWVASVILSWLAFEGICSVMENLGPDHIVYPSLQDQPLVEASLPEDFAPFFSKFREDSGLDRDETVASFPNKFVFLAPAGQEEQFAEEIEARVRSKWRELSQIVLTWIGDKKDQLASIFNRQTDNFWQFSWSSTHLVTLDNENDINTLFEADKFKDIFQTIKDFSKGGDNTKRYADANYLYPVTHSLVQTVMASAKGVSFTTRAPEPGIKCPVCGEFEVLHEISAGKYEPHEYKAQAEKFWNSISKRLGRAMVKESEQLCAICVIKRLAPHALEKFAKDHPLRTIFKDGYFPSTTEMATFEFREKLREKGLLSFTSNGKMDLVEQMLVDELHEEGEKESQDENGKIGGFSRDVSTLLEMAKREGIKRSEEDKYYAILMMDGDKMGDLVNGLTIEARWRDVLHPELVDRYDKGLLKANGDFWRGKNGSKEVGGYFQKKRIISPALHSALSESLGAFSLHVVPHIIRKCQGKLIYAGGDDVAAVLPLSRAFEAASKIRKAYNMRFVTINKNGLTEVENVTDGRSPVLLLPGKGEKISISAAIVICHHKQPLRGALEEAHHLLDGVAKKKEGRNAVAVRLKKRSGHQRDFSARWDAPNLFFQNSVYGGQGDITIVDSFLAVQSLYGSSDISSSKIYQFRELEVMIRSVLKGSVSPSSEESVVKPSLDQIEKIVKIFAAEIARSGNSPKKDPGKYGEAEAVRASRTRELAAHIAGITISWDRSADEGRGGWQYSGEVPVIARYLSRGGASS